MLLGNGDGTFQMGQTYVFGTEIGGAVAADFNLDSKTDLAICDKSDGIWLFLGNGDGTLQAPRSILSSSRTMSIATGDFNGDGKPDLVFAYVSSANSGGISVLLGNGDGTFGPQQDYPVGGWGFHMLVGDFDGDSKLDVALTLFSTNNVAVFLGRGDGTFLSPQKFGVSGRADSVATGNFQLGGKLGLATANANPSGLSVLLNTTP
jgi:hypothetical protein